MYRTRNAAWGKTRRGFESRPLRQRSSLTSKIESLEPFCSTCILKIMKIKYITYLLGYIFIYPSLSFSTETVICSFRDSQNIYREFMLKRTGESDKTFMDVEKINSPFWKVMSDDKNKLILFREMLQPRSPKQGSVHSIFFIDKNTGTFRFRNYIHANILA